MVKLIKLVAIKKAKDDYIFYNEINGGVDTVDKLFAAYYVAKKTRRSPVVVLFSLLNIILYRYVDMVAFFHDL